MHSEQSQVQNSTPFPAYYTQSHHLPFSEMVPIDGCYQLKIERTGNSIYRKRVEVMLVMGPGVVGLKVYL
jgi:hypothetical protein